MLDYLHRRRADRAAQRRADETLVADALCEQPNLSPQDLVERTGLDRRRLEAALARLEDVVAVRWHWSHDSPPRRLYQITDKGAHA